MEKQNQVSIRDIQIAIFNILCRFDEICKKHSITYYLTGGTALGAVRHKGFIPWDDDIDVAMPRSEYERFSRCAQKELGDSYFWQTHQTDPNYHLLFGKIRKNNTYAEETFNIPHLLHNGIFIDVFPLDGAPNRLFRKLNFGIPKYINRLIFRKNVGRKIQDGFIEEVWMLAAQILPYPFLHWILAMCISLYPYERSKYFVNLGGAYSYEKETAPKTWLNPPKYMLFEKRLFPVMKDYDLFLKHLYGDYMKLPPEENRVPHYTKVVL